MSGLLVTLLLVLRPLLADATSHPVHRRHVQSNLQAYTVNERAVTRPLTINNQCSETVHPAILTQSGGGPTTGGFALLAGHSKNLTVGPDWQGRVWGRTNCSFNPDGTAPSKEGGFDGTGKACVTGDCVGVLNCKESGQTPVTLAEFTLSSSSGQAFYDLSLVDGYNLPLAIVLLGGGNKTFDDIPPNLTNPSCVGTGALLAAEGYDPYNNSFPVFLGTNSTFPLPFDQSETVNSLTRWCPWDLQLQPPSKPGSGVYPYPDDKIQRPIFDPCFSACAKDNSPKDCCTGAYDDPSKCKPSLYSQKAKAACPDAYSYAYDDKSSTFIVPSGSGFEVVFCPGARSTNIFKTKAPQIGQLAEIGRADFLGLRDQPPVQTSATAKQITLSTIWISSIAWGFGLASIIFA